MNDWLGGQPGASGYNYSPRDKGRVTRKVGVTHTHSPTQLACRLAAAAHRGQAGAPAFPLHHLRRESLRRQPTSVAFLTLQSLADLRPHSQPGSRGWGGGGRHVGGRRRLGVLRFAGGWKSPTLLYPINTFVPPEMRREGRV